MKIKIIAFLFSKYFYNFYTISHADLLNTCSGYFIRGQWLEINIWNGLKEDCSYFTDDGLELLQPGKN